MIRGMRIESTVNFPFCLHSYCFISVFVWQIGTFLSRNTKNSFVHVFLNNLLSLTASCSLSVFPCPCTLMPCLFLSPLSHFGISLSLCLLSQSPLSIIVSSMSLHSCPSFSVAVATPSFSLPLFIFAPARFHELCVKEVLASVQNAR